MQTARSEFLRPKPTIGILTLTQSENYGTVLQAYATRKLFESITSQLDFRLVPTDVRWVRRKRVLALFNPWNPSTGFTRAKNFASMRRFIQPEIVASRRYLDISRREDALRYLSRHYDALITGSDEIWNLANVGGRSVYYLPPDLGKYRAAFATSANRLNFSALDANTRATLRASLERYDYIAVRDTNTLNFVSSFGLSLEPVEVIDPTLVFDFADVRPMSATSPRVAEQRRILVMVHCRQIGAEVVRRMAGYGTVHSAFSKYSGAKLLHLSPLEFASVFGDYDVVITDFFHGTCMSVRNRAQFVCFDSEPIYALYESKIANLARKLGFMSNYINAASMDTTPAVDAITAAATHILDGTSVRLDYENALEKERKKAIRSATEICEELIERLSVVDRE